MLTVVARMFLGMVGLLFLACTDSSAATEQRCTELGVNCVCSEPFNTASFTYTKPRYVFTDSSKFCNANGEGGQAIRNSGDLFMSNDVGLRSALTANPAVTHVLRGPEGHTGLWFMGHLMNDTQFVKRTAMRFYLYTSPNFEFTLDGACTNHKFVQNSYIAVTAGGHGTGMRMYNMSFWGPQYADCCFGGPQLAGGDPGPQRGEWLGKWWRHELVMTNRAGGTAPNGARLQYFVTNITDHLPERLVLDTNGPGQGIHNFVPTPNLTPMGPVSNWMPSLYRQDTCAGWHAVSHFMLAGWDTDSAQRIGPALEIEGGGGDVSPAAPPH